MNLNTYQKSRAMKIINTIKTVIIAMYYVIIILLITLFYVATTPLKSINQENKH